MLRTIVSAAVAVLIATLPGAAPSRAETASDLRISGPVVHENLAVYLIHGPSRSGPVPLTLQEALEAKRVEVRETGQVNSLEIENVGDSDVFIQSGDIVKGGRQDRVLTSSLVLPPHSGAVPIDSFCVEQGRWSQRAGEDGRRFESAAAALPSRVAKLALAGAGAPAAGPDRALRAEPATPSRQQQVWQEVTAIQKKLTRSLAVSVAEPRSATSLQLSLENKKLRAAEDDYVRALEPAGESDADVVGYAIAINGKVASADVYPSNGLFRKLWPKLLRASVAEAIGDKLEQTAQPPGPDSVQDFLKDAQSAEVTRKVLPTRGSVEMRQNDRVLFQEAKPAPASAAVPAADSWAHRNYLAK